MVLKEVLYLNHIHFLVEIIKEVI